MRALACFVFTFALSHAVVFSACARFWKRDAAELTRLFFLTLGVGPALVSWLLVNLLRRLPGRSDAFYLTAVVALFALLLLLNPGGLRQWVGVFGRRRAAGPAAASRFARYFRAAAFVAGGVVALAVGFYSTAMPLYDNDPLEYAILARLFYTHKAVDFYPILDAAPFGGVYFPSSHPLGFPGLLTWMHVCDGAAEQTVFLKLVNPMFFLCTLALLGHALAASGRIAQAVGLLSFLGTPYYLHLVYVQHVDPMRVHLFFVGLLWIGPVLERRRPAVAVMAGVAIGLAMFSHSIGFLTLPLAGAAYWILQRDPWRVRMWKGLLVAGAALLLSGQRYWRNYVTFGSPIRDTIPVYTDVPQLDYDAHVRYTRGLATVRDRLLNGVGKGFTKTDLFGYGYWLLLLAPLTLARRDAFAAPGGIGLWTVLLYFALLAGSAMLGIDAAIKHDRYMLTIHPFVALLGGRTVGLLYERWERR